MFRLGGTGRIVLADPRSADDRFAAADFTNDVQETATLAIKIGTSVSRHSILIGNIDLPSVQVVLRRLGISVPTNLDPEGYVLLVNANEVVVAGKTAAGTFYGLQTLKQLVRGASFSLYGSAAFRAEWLCLSGTGASDLRLRLARCWRYSLRDFCG